MTNKTLKNKLLTSKVFSLHWRNLKMKGYTKEAIKKICEEENIKYIRMQFSDMEGMLKNVEIPVHRLDDALNNEIMFDGSSVEGFVRTEEADMFLYQTLILS